MNDETDPQLQFTAQRVAELSRRVDIDLQHKAALRLELLRRHRELSVEHIQRPGGSLWRRITTLKRLTLVAPAALAAATAFSVLFWSLPIHSHPQSAEAAQLRSAVVRSFPTVKSWGWTLHQDKESGPSTSGCSVTFTPQQRLYIRADRPDRPYLFSNGRWYLVTPQRANAPCPPEWQWAFALLPSHLANSGITRGSPIGGEATDVITYSEKPSSNVEIRSTAVVERKSGLVRQLQRVILKNGKVVEKDWSNYRYERY